MFGSRFVRGGTVVDYPLHKLCINRLANWFIKVLFRLRYNDTTNAFKLYRREVIEGVQPILSHHFNLTVELPLKAIVRGFSYAIIPNRWYNRKTGISKLKIKKWAAVICSLCFISGWKNICRAEIITAAKFSHPIVLLS